MGKTKCPKCHRSFDDDVKRYVWGTVTNTAKITINLALQIGGSLVGGKFGKVASNGGGRLGEMAANAIGCGEKDIKGWWHKCPYCKHEWE